MAPRRPILLMTRPRAASERFVADLRAADAPDFAPLYAPLLSIKTLGPLPELAGCGGLIFTSANGVRSYAALGGAKGAVAYCVGDATAEAAQAHGLTTLSADGDADDLVELLKREAPDGSLWHLRGRNSRGDVARCLTDAGVPVRDAIIYDQPLVPLTAKAIAALKGDVPVVAPLFSPRTAQHFAAQKTGKAPLFVAAISAAVAEAVTLPYLRGMIVAQRPNADAMLTAVTKLLIAAAMLEAPGDAQ